MNAIILSDKNQLILRNVPRPENPRPGHLIIKMSACGINSGDKMFIAGAFPRGIPASRYDIAGVSGVGTVIETGEGVPLEYKGKNVAVYRSLRSSENTIGTWSEFAQLHYLNCAIIPETAYPRSFAGSLVNIVTAYAFLKHAISEDHKGIVCTAGNSATGRAMLGICLRYDFPLISVVRSESSKMELISLGAKQVVVQQDADFSEQLKTQAALLNTTAVFDGVGGALLTAIIGKLPFNSTVYAYGFLDGETPVGFSTKLLMRGITIKGFANYRTATVMEDAKLAAALHDISGFMDAPHYMMKTGKFFRFEEAAEAIAFSSSAGKAVLVNELQHN